MSAAVWVRGNYREAKRYWLRVARGTPAQLNLIYRKGSVKRASSPFRDSGSYETRNDLRGPPAQYIKQILFRPCNRNKV